MTPLLYPTPLKFDYFENIEHKLTPPPVNATQENSPLPEAEDLLQRGDFSAILQSKDLFTALFYKFAAANKQNDRLFEVVAGGRTIIGRAHILEQVQGAVETIHQLVLQALSEKRSLTLLPIRPASNYFLREKKSDGPYDLSDWLTSKERKINELSFDQYVRPCIAPLMTSLGATCSSSEINQVVKLGPASYQTYAHKIGAIQIDWKDEPQAGAASAS